MPTSTLTKRRSKGSKPRRSGDASNSAAARAAEFERWLVELTSLPTAAAREDRVIAWIERWARAREKWLDIDRDEHGNVLIRRTRDPKQARRAPLYITAHLDHPAFVVRSAKGREVELEFRGGVHDPYFDKAKLEIIDAKDRLHIATIVALDAKATPFKVVKARLAKATGSIMPGDLARWKLPAPTIKKGILHTHGCDDLAAVAAALAAFERIRGQPDSAHVGLLLTRSEEIGFVGAIGAARGGSIPHDARLICLENSRSFAESPIGSGAIVRVGDRASVFTPDLTNRVAAILLEHQKTTPSFKFQRKLMPGGTCEATAFSCYGYASTCLCLPLGNYHNMADIDGVLSGKRPARVGPEFIAISDFHGLIEMLEVIARELDATNVPLLKDRMEQLWREHGHLLAT